MPPRNLWLAHLDHAGEIVGAPGQHPAEPFESWSQALAERFT
jgi:hypothetical protein